MRIQRVDLVIPVYRPTAELNTIIERMASQTVPIRRLILMVTDPEKTNLPDLSAFGDVLTVPVKKEDFDHGATRQQAANLSDGDFVLFMTQDAVPADEHLVENLLVPFEDEKVAVSYARQLPKEGAKPAERLTRNFNYPDTSVVKTSADRERLGIKTYFSSDACAMYRKDTFDKVGGFDSPMIFNEDMVYAFHALEEGYAVAYAAEAEVFHSHNLTGWQQFKRNFDLGVSQADHPEVFANLSSVQEGGSMVKIVTKGLLSKGHVGSWIAFLYQCGMRFVGYRFGRSYKTLPRKMVLKMTSNRSYWKEVEHGTDSGNKM